MFEDKTPRSSKGLDSILASAGSKKGDVVQNSHK
jgi:hypothetical protein